MGISGVPNLISVIASKISISLFLIQMLGPAITTSQLYFLRTMMILVVVFNIFGIIVAIDFSMTTPEAIDAGSIGYFLDSQVQELLAIIGSG